MLPTTHNSLKWLGNLTRYYQRCKTAATLTETERCLLHRQGPRLGPQVTADKTFRVWCTGSRSPRPAPASFHRVQETVRWGRCSDGDGHRRRLLPEGQLILVHSHHRLLRLLHVGCILASEYPVSEPWAPGFLHKVLGGPLSHPPKEWVLACLANSRRRVLVCLGIMQA